MPLPADVLRDRVRNELLMCQRQLHHIIEISDPEFNEFPVEVEVTMTKTPGPILLDGKISHLFNHKLKMIITEDYPYEKPIIKWQTEIFHPNIMLPDDGGYVCTRLLDDWSFASNLLSFIKGVESLLVNPNAGNPYGSDSCTRAAEYFNTHEYTPPVVVKKKNPPKIVK
jgi:ubiquitin-protein ligase